MWLFGAGLNWYWSRCVRLMLGYELALVRGTEQTGNLQVFQGPRAARALNASGPPRAARTEVRDGLSSSASAPPRSPSPRCR